MILEQTGKICDGFYSTGYHFLPAFLLASATPVLFDAGVAAMGPYYLRDIEKYLGRADTLGYLLLTHSHYDHCGAIPFPTLMTLPIAPVLASVSRFGVYAASSGVKSFNEGCRALVEQGTEGGGTVVDNLCHLIDACSDSILQRGIVDRRAALYHIGDREFELFD